MILQPVDQAVRDQGFNFVPFNQYLSSPFQFQTNQTSSPTSEALGITSLKQPFIKPYVGGGGIFETGPLGPTSPLLNQENFYNLTSDQYFKNQDTPNVDNLYQSKVDQTFMNMPSYREQDLSAADLGEYIASGTDIPLELTGAGIAQQQLGRVNEGIGSLGETLAGLGPVNFLMNKMDRFDSLPKADQEFIKLNMGYTGPTVFGGDQSGLSRDPFGIFTRSALGNYAERVGKEYDKMTDVLSPEGKVGSKFSGATYNPVTGLFESEELSPEELERINKRTNLLRKKQVFYRKQTELRDRNRRIQEANEKREAERLAALSRAESARQYDPSIHGPTNYGLGSDGRQSFDTGQGFGANATTGGPVSNRTGRGRTDYMDGGLADLVDIYD
jgi:hypothetical protein|tara:strand:+ start:1513 stop:2673 length:1161 start_codon:yes stop_codon:yes gene_type:complete